MKRLLPFCIAVLLFAAYSCNDAAVTPEEVTVDTLPAIDTSTTTRPEQPDITTIEHRVKKKSASIAYSYFTSIRRQEVKQVNAYLSVQFPEAKARDTLRQIERSQEVNVVNADTNIISSLKIQLYDEVAISLLDPGGDFTIEATGHVNDRQRVDTVEGNKWGWSVQAKTDKKESLLVLKVTAYRPDREEVLDNRRIGIQVKLEGGMLRKLWAVLLDDPKNFLWLILVPVIGFLGKWWYEKWKKK